MIGLYSFIITVGLMPGILGAATTPRWALLAALTPWFLSPSPKLTAGHLLLVLFALWSAIGLTWASDQYGGALSLAKLAIIGGVFCIGAQLPDLRQVLSGAALGLGVSSIAAIAQLFGWRGVDQFSVPGGLFFNPNFMAEAAVLVLVGLIAERIWWGIPLVIPAAILPVSRGALVALAVACIAMCKSTALRLGMIGASILGLAGALYFNPRMTSIEERLAIWRDTLDGMTIFGRGLGSFYLEYPAFATRTDTLLTRPNHAHNDALEMVFESGVGAALVAVFLFALLRRPSERTAWLVVVAFSVQSLFSFPLHNPVTAFLVAMAAGVLCSSWADIRSHVGEWRSAFRARRRYRILRYASVHR